MNIKNNIKIGFAAMAIAFGMTSCNDWLDVEMEDSIMENSLFSNDEGYLSNLNGVYAKMNENYGFRLTMGGIDAMAQYYNVSRNQNSAFYNYANFNFDELEDVSNSIWTTQYSMIANLNTLLEHANADGTLSAKYAPYVKGEALALRAFLHFDLMRLYGPIYSTATENDKAIPYQDTSSKDIQPILPAKDVMAKIIRDLKEASELLKNDRVRTDGVVNTAAENLSEPTTLRYRQFRMNYYAVQALLARAYMWIGDKTNAAAVAKSLIDENDEKKVFPWTPKAQVTTDTNPDKLFSTEVMFSMYNTSRANYFNGYFNTNVSSASGLTMMIYPIEELDWNTWEYVITGYLKRTDMMYDEENDLRKQYMWSEGEMKTTDDYGVSTTSQAIFFSKYAPLTNTANPSDNARCFQYMIPLVRMSELYLILAECEIADHEASIGYVNKIRANRNCPNITLAGTESDAAIKQYITNEFMREFVGEGQLYFYYKRNAMQSVLSDGEVGYDSSYTKQEFKNRTMDLSNYTWPLPPDEVDKRAK